MSLELTIIVPIYNVEKYLEDCLESIYSIKNISKEVILINDNSSDNSYEIMKKYKKKYPLETVIVIHEVNKGLAETRNSGLKIAKGKYISFIDSDDMILPKEYEELFLFNKNKELDIILGNGKYYKDKLIKERFFRKVEIEKLGITTGKNLLENMLKLNNYYEMVWLNFYRNDFLIENDFKFYRGLLHEDALFSFMVLLRANKVKYINKDFYLYRQREGSIMSKITLKNEKHRLFICDSLSNIVFKDRGNINYYLFRYIFNLYWGVFCRNKIQNGKVLHKVLFLKTKSLKIFIKKFLLVVNFPFNKKIKNLNIN